MAITLVVTTSGKSPYKTSIPWQSNLNVHKALEIAYNQVQNHSIFSFAIDFYGTSQQVPYGYFVIMMNNIYDLPGQRIYWALTVNGSYSQRGIDYTYLNDGDVIQFANTTYNAEEHKGTDIEIKHFAYLALIETASA